ncbi:MAG TPA: prepilin-type N-terminal cleavage/methylation domain-containing protein [Nitrospira sp.]|nr:prepilin-type N-terminal cleavage/methylation domain-containing protein [Nitrospira sp.]
MKQSQAGFTLLESMLAGAILTIGLLALSAMQAMSMSRNVGTKEMTQVSNLAADMIERIQFNRRNVTAYHNITVNSSTTTCPAAAVNVMANGDCTQWRTLLLNSGLSNVSGSVTLNPVPPAVDPQGLTRSTVTVRLNWLATQRGEGTMAMNKAMTLVTVIAPE